MFKCKINWYFLRTYARLRVSLYIWANYHSCLCMTSTKNLFVALTQCPFSIWLVDSFYVCIRNRQAKRLADSSFKNFIPGNVGNINLSKPSCSWYVISPTYSAQKELLVVPSWVCRVLQNCVPLYQKICIQLAEEWQRHWSILEIQHLILKKCPIGDNVILIHCTCTVLHQYKVLH